ncbi:MAG: thiamine pyrophosphate-dependent enzyme, partial [Lentisphaeria bacterium]|nr:thiamine pyrophosphate-dependent enzyme [Lentisphaeria bacterium]
EALDTLAGLIADSTSRLLVAGELRQADVPAVRRLAEHLQWPLYADIASGLRLGAPPCRVTAAAAAAASPDLVLHVGGKLVSKQIQNTVAACRGTVVQALDHCERQDPDHRTNLRIEADIPALCDAVRTGIPQPTASPPEAVSDKAVDELLAADSCASEASIARAVARQIPATGALFLGNSMPVRNMDLFASTDGAAVPVGVNRGASGIDGLIATASGFAKGMQRHVTLLIGDVSCLHDLSSLALAQHHRLTIVILNNDGGGIFGHLPIAERTDVFENYFLTPHGRRFEHTATMFELNYVHTGTTENFRQAYEDALNSDASTIIEVTIDRQHSIDTHRRLVELEGGNADPCNGP